MKLYTYIILFAAVCFFAALYHEKDIVRSCKQYGEAGLSSWTGDIKCKEMEVD